VFRITVNAICPGPVHTLMNDKRIEYESGSPGCSAQTFGHTGSTGTLCWADRASDTICVVLTSLPGRAAKPHPRELAAARVAAEAAR